MSLLELLALMFFRTFGITEPEPQKLRGAAWFLLLLVFMILLAFIAGATILFHKL